MDQAQSRAEEMERERKAQQEECQRVKTSLLQTEAELKTAHENMEQAAQERKDLEIERYISKEEAFEALKRDLGSHAGLLDGLTENPLPASFELRALQVGEEMEVLKEIKASMESLEGVAEAQYSEEWLGRLKNFIGTVRLVGFIIGGLLCLGVLFIVTNTIKLTIYTRKEEVNVLLMVGATDGFIKTPFILEGMIQGALSGAVSIIILFLGYLAVSSKGFALFEAATFRFAFIPIEYVLSLFLVSIGLGLLGSYIAVGRFYEL